MENQCTMNCYSFEYLYAADSNSMYLAILSIYSKKIPLNDLDNICGRQVHCIIYSHITSSK